MTATSEAPKGRKIIGNAPIPTRAPRRILESNLRLICNPSIVTDGETLADALTNLLHLAEKEGWNFNWRLDQARAYYELEKRAKPLRADSIFEAIDSIKSAAAAFFAIDPVLLVGQSKRWEVVWPRMVAMALSYELVEGATLELVAAAFNRKDHGTVMSAQKRVRNICKAEPAGIWLRRTTPELLASQVDQFRLMCTLALAHLIKGAA